MSIWTDSTLHRIIEAVDATKQTAALSHHWSFIMKLIGRHKTPRSWNYQWQIMWCLFKVSVILSHILFPHVLIDCELFSIKWWKYLPFREWRMTSTLTASPANDHSLLVIKTAIWMALWGIWEISRLRWALLWMTQNHPKLIWNGYLTIDWGPQTLAKPSKLKLNDSNLSPADLDPRVKVMPLAHPCHT